jgi:hypothetical protein
MCNMPKKKNTGRNGKVEGGQWAGGSPVELAQGKE